MFRAGAARPATLGRSLWPFAIQRVFLLPSDTIKDAIDLIAARYPEELADSREAFEREILEIDFPRSSEPERAKKYFRLLVFRTIGSDHLATLEGKEVLRNAPPATREATNPRPFQVTMMPGDGSDPHWWLREEGVDLDAPANAALLVETEAAVTELGLSAQDAVKGDLLDAASRLQALWVSAQGGGAARKVADYAKDIVARGCAKLASTTNALRERADLLNAICELVEPLLDDPSPELTEDAEAKDESSLISTRGVRSEAAEAVMSLCRVNAVTAARFETRLKRLARDPHPAVRLAVASRLAMLWETARDLMWGLAGIFGSSEQNRRVLRFFADFLMCVLHVDPACVEALVFAVLPRVHGRTERAGEELLEAIGSIMVILWVTHARDRAHAALQGWLENPAEHEGELGHALDSIRDGLVVGYGTDDTKDRAIRGRCQQFAAHLVTNTAAGMQQYFDLPPTARTDADSETATRLAKLLDETGDLFYFASGAFHEGQAGDPPPLTTDALKREFLNDNYSIFRRIGDVGTPHTIFHLIEMLGYLVPGDPARVFDLAAHALLTAGRNQGFQFESLGADRFVEVIGLFLADHREIFDDTTRRDQLVACLEAFVETGWPVARRLLYRLPELLQ
jgi:hypothetical protein